MKKKFLTLGLIISNTLFIKADLLEITEAFPLYQIKEVTKEDLITQLLKNKENIISNIKFTKMLQDLLLKFYIKSTFILKPETRDTEIYQTFMTNVDGFFKECGNPYLHIIDKKFKKQEKSNLDRLTRKELDKLLSLSHSKSNLVTNINTDCGYLYQKAMNNFHEIKKIDKLAIEITKAIMSSYPRIK